MARTVAGSLLGCPPLLGCLGEVAISVLSGFRAWGVLCSRVLRGFVWLKEGRIRYHEEFCKTSMSFLFGCLRG